MEIGIYRHYKGKFYQVFDVAKHSESLEEMVVYQALYGDFGLWVRPKAMFQEKVTVKSGESIPRFALVYQDDGESDENDRLLTLFDNEFEMKQVVKKLKDKGVSFEIYEERLDPKPKHLPNDIVYKLLVDDEDFERAIEILKQ